jgi:S1/P1 Nuclease
MKVFRVAVAAIAMVAAGPAFAWGDLGHRVTALIAYEHLNAKAKTTLDALLASDTDSLTAPDFASRASWADKYRSSHPDTFSWHFVDIEIDKGDVSSACYNFPPLRPGQAASDGPAKDCVINKIDEFAVELGNPQAPAAERLLALKFLIHFVGDMHQPLHSSDHHDKGANCVGLSPLSPDGQEKNLHAYWDSGTVNALGSDAATVAQQLNASISEAQADRWSNGTTLSWALETYEMAKRDTYHLPNLPTCSARGNVALPQAYVDQAVIDTKLQLQRAGIRMAWLLNKALGT